MKSGRGYFLDILAKKEYNYNYEGGRLVFAAEYAIGLDEYENVIAKDPCSSLYYGYDKEGNLIRKRVVLANGDQQKYFFDHPEDGNTVTTFTIDGETVTSHSKTDSFGRKEFDELQLGRGFVSRRFTYHDGMVTEEHQTSGKKKSSPVTQLVREILLSDGRTLAYEYDEEERITSVVEKDGDTVIHKN